MSTTKRSGSGFTKAERAAMKARAQELKAQGRSGQKKAENERAVLDAIADMPDDDRSLAERIHALVKANAPELLPKTWYGMPAYAKVDGKVVCFKAAAKFDGRYAVLGFEDAATLDEGPMWASMNPLTVPVKFGAPEMGWSPSPPDAPVPGITRITAAEEVAP